MLLFVQLVWTDLIRESDCFLLFVLCVLTVLDRNVCIKAVKVGGLCVARWRGGW